MGLEAYKRDKSAVEKGVWITLNNGVKVLLKEWGTPEFWASYLLNANFEGDNITTEEDVKATGLAIANSIVMKIDNDGTMIEGAIAVSEIINDPAYWELKSEIILESKKTELFRIKKSEKTKKP